MILPIDRVATAAGWRHLGLRPPKNTDQPDLFG